MPASMTRAFSLLLPVAILVSILLPRPASGQCGVLAQQFQNIGLETGNAFVADYSTTATSSLFKPVAPPTHNGLKSVARDSEGRVRIVRSAGNYNVKEPDGVVTEVERLNISICDPTTGALTTLDTADKTATILPRHSTAVPFIKPAQGQAQSFCATLFDMQRRFPRVTVEDLGHNTISGYDAIGIRIHYAPLLALGASSYNELWCSDALGAVLQQASESKSQKGTEFKNESTMGNIERREPEISLFQIPNDYTVIERANEGNQPGHLRAVAKPQ